MSGESLKIAAIAGSLRKGSFNRIAVSEAVKLAPDGMDVELLSIDEIPLYNGDIEDQGYPESVLKLAEKIKQADGILISTPEYSGYFSGVIKNTLDWLSRSGLGSPLAGKHVAIMGVSDGHYGTDKSQQHLKSLAIELDMKPFNRPKARMYDGPETFGESGIINERFKKQIRGLLIELEARILGES